ncbi:hypothetical protein HXA34_11270 [Salipaludibacillus agaradhaerens]|jgi:uncharacterized membrane-anchored protein YhcB (DUF1043 family)|uniref:hypothetical protein n=1 Tax=Salipaludibacillus agaradhaerens TaxID=76935 RepID=UPI0021515869|nr:hypothetical protein [Salipaludibacillus agaradhaerens]MCR6106868.1 hypothetical protein [Salipaludibacillus agaradhaerens]MCR6118900.1 hypothetical protein [Salipaludibacillus agaradhaerens]
MEDVWTVYLLPIIQYLVGPVIAGYVVYRLTDRKNRQAEKDAAVRQLNVLYAKINRIVGLVEKINELFTENDEYKKRMDEINEGNFENIKSEMALTHGDEHECFRIITEKKEQNSQEIRDLFNKASVTAKELRSIPTDLIPTEIHAEIVEIIESKFVALDISKYTQLMKKIKEATK